MKEVVINNVWRTKFYGYCDNVGKRCMHWEIEFPESELNKLDPFVHAGRKVKFEKEDGSIEEWDCPPITYVKNHRFIHNGDHCDIFSAIGFRKNERGENVCYTTAFFPIAYRRYREGDTIRITGDRGQHLFNIECGNIELNKGIELGVECVLVRGEDTEGTVRIPRGILANEQTYLDARCIELVQAVEDKTTVLERIDDGPNSQLYIIDEPSSAYAIARIWFNPEKVPKEVVKAFIENIKDYYDDIIVKRKTMNSEKEITYEEATENNLNKIAEITKDCVDKYIQEYYGDDWKNTDREADEIGVFDYDKLTYFLYNDTGYVWIDQPDNMFSVVTEKFIKSRFNLTECNEYLGCALNIEYNQKYLIIGTHTFYPSYSDTGAGDFSVNSMIEEVHYKTGLCEKFIKHLLILIDIRRRNFKKKTNLVMRVIL